MMPHEPVRRSRREFVIESLGAAAALAGTQSLTAAEPPTPNKRKAQIAITLDLEMSRNFPVWEEMRWDYEKGNLNDESKAYTVEACRRVKSHGGVLHTFCVARVCEQENVDWLRGIAQAGHPIGNHTYDHVNVRATELEDVQFRFRRAPWLAGGRTAAELIRENIRLANEAIKTRIGVPPAGFRTPGGFNDGLSGRDDLQRMLLDLGFTWVSSQYLAHPVGEPMQKPTAAALEAIVATQVKSQPLVYPTGLVEVPMSPISDIGAFRTGRWKLEWFKDAIRLGVQWAIDHGAAYDFLAHPSCLYVTDPKFETIEMICEMVSQAGDRAELVSVDTLAGRAKS
jgi:peptidoglycan/xylan/chitin deacetylase (PgdA/CDA1 family)